MRLVARSAACGHIVAVSRRLAGTRTGPGDSVTDRLSPRSLRLHVSHGHSRPSTLRMLFAVKVKSIGCRRPNTVSSVVVFGTARVFGLIRAGSPPLHNQQTLFGHIGHVCTRCYASFSPFMAQQYLHRSHDPATCLRRRTSLATPASTPPMSEVAKSTWLPVNAKKIAEFWALRDIVCSQPTGCNHRLV